MGGVQSYPEQVVQLGSPSTDGGGEAEEHNQHKSDGVDTLMGCPGPILAIFFGKGNTIQCSQLHFIETFLPPVCGFVPSYPGFYQEATKSSG